VTCCLFGSDETEALYIANELSHALKGGPTLCFVLFHGFVPLYTCHGCGAETSPTGRHCSAAVLYRTGAVAKLVEKALIRAGISYRVTGGFVSYFVCLLRCRSLCGERFCGAYSRTRLFDHQEIKDIVAYLQVFIPVVARSSLCRSYSPTLSCSVQVALNPGDALAFKRAVGTPRRGIGPQTISALEAHATARKLPIFTVCQRVVQGEGVKGVSPAAVKALGPFTHAILTLKMASNDPAVPLSDAVQRMLTSLKFPEYLQREFGVDASNRMAHVAELLACIKSFDGDASAVEAANEDDPVSAKPSQRLAHLLQHMALVSDVDALHKGGSGGSVVTLSTVHAAKGMEWDTVFVLGVETNLFPHARSVVADDVDKPATSSSSFKEDPVDEERRLLYVAVTRARRNLYITRALRRCLNGRVCGCPVIRLC
jgi:DNA helicase II / ATP-dependent DNA helicase PcrA